MYHLPIAIDRKAAVSLTEQISTGVRNAIRDGRLAPGARLPSWQDLATQLGVARGTVRLAYEVLRDEQLISTAGAAGSHVAAQPVLPMQAQRGADMRGVHAGADSGVIPRRGAAARPGIFQVAVPAQDAFPYKTWSRIMARSARRAAASPLTYPDRCGEAELRAEIAAYLCIARGMDCAPEQVFITNGHAGALSFALQVLSLHGERAWIENPCYPVSRDGLALAGMQAVPVPVDQDGVQVDVGMELAGDASLAIVSPGQQAPLGVTLALPRRLALLDWAAQAGAWIIEDDYMGELQLQARAAPALAALDRAGRVLHIGTFSKTLSPALRVGFLVVPQSLVGRFVETAATLYPAPSPTVQLAVAEFLRSGLYLRHLRHMKRLYGERRMAIARALDQLGARNVPAGLSVLLEVSRDGDALVAARAAGFTPSALSGWFAAPDQAPQGLLLGATNVPAERAYEYCSRLLRTADR
ncbi:MocR-like pyridoxine biosynthesis transcription factor PdxR [Pseudoduganella sp. RAF53_2]|uniref:MocR-like pyridoxine biosynthesis transcription factor PdxR n=1 Tax=unclassified Pseudoduganella TaxID=2637179 RepID=UPI003F9C6E79